MSENQLEAKNENISVSMTRDKGSKVKLTINVKPEAAEAAYFKALKAINKEVSLPGFRKGKAPDDFIAKNYPKQIENEWRNTILQTGLKEAIDLLKVYPFRQGDVKCTSFKELSKENGAEFTLEYESAPQIPTVELDKIELKHVERRPVTQDQINTKMEDMQFQFADWVEVKDRGIKDSDYVNLTIQQLEEEPYNNICENTRFSMHKMAPWMKTLLISKEAGETVEGISEPEPGRESQPFKPTRCKITIDGIFEGTMPELNDDFAKRVGAPNISALNEAIIGYLNKQADQELANNLYRQVDEFFVNQYHFEIPQSIVESELKQREESMENWLVQNNISDDAKETYRKNFQDRAKIDIDATYRLFFIYSSLARRFNITVSKEEVAQLLAQELLQGRGYINEQNREEVSARMSQQLMQEKCKKYIIDHVKRL